MQSRTRLEQLRRVLAPLCVALAAGLTGAAGAQPTSGYKLGDRLPQSPAKPGAPAVTQYTDITWQQLIAPGWNPAEIIKDLQLGVLNDADPRAREAMSRLREAWNKAPGNPALDGAAVRIPGFVVPLDAPGSAQKEFLLVPYFGACIHTPPPPANQIIHVVSDKPLKDVGEMYAVWVRGTLANSFTDTAMGSAGYRMKLADVKPYEPEKPAQGR